MTRGAEGLKFIKLGAAGLATDTSVGVRGGV